MPPIGGRRDKAELKYEKEVYTPEGAKSISDRQLRKEYTRLRSIAKKRLERFEGTEWTDTQVYKLNTEHGKPIYKPLKEIKTNRELRHLFSDLARFVMADTGSVSGLEAQREKGVETLNARGYDFINKENYRKFADFMEYARMANLNRLYDSKRLADFYEWAEKRKLSGEELYKSFRNWTKNEKKLRKIQNKNPRNSSQYREQVDTGLDQKYIEDGKRLIKQYQDKKGKKK